jgi:hypothetical protein
VTLRHTLVWLLVAIAIGIAALPGLVYLTGVATLGPYSGGSFAAFYGAFLQDLVRLQTAAWVLAIGPAALLFALRLLAAYAWPRQDG